ncbi:MAG TPA: hypothetical protein VEA99_09565 [Gemmatimonadaceae bacterium]|nr:hypothetical protein [Gemmatimonadaceae bacterium]
MPLRTGVLACASAVVLLGCGRSTDGSMPVHADRGIASAGAAVIAALDSCEQGGRPTMRWSGGVRAFDRFTLFVPDSAALVGDADAGHFTLSWPGCPDACRFAVGVHADSGINLEARVARMVAEQRLVDSMNADPRSEAMEFDVLAGPPQPFDTSHGRGYRIDDACGDCAASTLMFGKAGLIASVSLSADAMPGAGHRMCEMMAVARSFAWRR